MKRKRNYLLPVILICICFFAEEKARSIPAFSRKYQTSCMTCHVGFPKLNSFGKAFRYNGYQFPINDAEKIKEEPVELGSDAYKKVWPKAVWPNSIPGTVPLAIRANTGFLLENAGDSAFCNDVGQPSIQLLAAGTISERISVYMGTHLMGNGDNIRIDRLFVRFNDLLKKYISENSLNIRLGQLIPDIVPIVSIHRGLTVSNYAMNTYSPEAGKQLNICHNETSPVFRIEHAQWGIESSGIINRFRYVFGLGNGNTNTTTDFPLHDLYGRLSYKWGGLPFDGSIEQPVSPEEKSITLGLLGYRGIKKETDSQRNFQRIGMNADIYLSKLNLLGGYITSINESNQEEKYRLYFSELNYAFYPWLLGLIRYEYVKPGNLSSVGRIIPHISALVVANMQIKLESILHTDDFRFNNLYLGFDVAF